MTRDELLAQFGSTATTVKPVALDGHPIYYVRRITVGESLQLTGAGKSEDNGDSSVESWRVLMLCLSDENGNRTLGDTPEDEALARALPAVPFLHVVNAALEFNGMIKAGRAAELAKNLLTSRS